MPELESTGIKKNSCHASSQSMGVRSTRQVGHLNGKEIMKKISEIYKHILIHALLNDYLAPHPFGKFSSHAHISVMIVYVIFSVIDVHNIYTFS
jgi:hypothetical protein